MLVTVKTVDKKGNKFRWIQNLTRTFNSDIENYIEITDDFGVTRAWEIRFEYEPNLIDMSVVLLNKGEGVLEFIHKVDVNESYGSTSVGSVNPFPFEGFFPMRNAHISYMLRPLRGEGNPVELSLDFWEKVND